MLELRALDANGEDLEVLPDWSDLTVSQDLLTAGQVTFSYPIDGRNAELLTHGRQLAAVIEGQQPDNFTFTYSEGTGSRLLEKSGKTSGLSTYSCKSNYSRLAELSLAPAFGSTVADENLFAFTNRTPGWLVINAVNNGMSRAMQRSANPTPWLRHPLVGFTATTDSAGKPWPVTYDATFTVGSSKVTDVIDWLVTRGFAEPRMRGRDLLLYLPENNGSDLTVGDNPVVVQTGIDFTEASYATKSSELVNALLVLGENNSCAWVYDQASIDTWGYREGTLTVSNASTQATLIAAGNAWLRSRKDPRWSYTYAVSGLYVEQPVTADSPPRPFLDYQVGDSILTLDGETATSQRIRLLSATWPNARASSVALTVNDFFDEWDAELDRRMTQLGG